MNRDFRSIDKYTQDTELISSLEAERVAISNKDFSYILNSPAINAFSHVTSTALAILQPRSRTAVIKVVEGNVELSISLSTKKGSDSSAMLSSADFSLEPSTQKLFTLAKIKYTTTGNKEVVIPIHEYKDIMGLSNENKARVRVKEDLETLYSMSIGIKYNKETKNKVSSEYNGRFFQSTYYENGKIVLKFTDDFAKYMDSGYQMPFPMKLLAIPCNRTKNPYVFAVGNKIYELCKLNAYDKETKKKKDAFRTTVRTLLEVFYLNGLKRPDQIRNEAKDSKKKPRLSQLIIEPFDNTLNTLEKEGVIKYHYCYPKGETIPEEVLSKSVNFDEWINRSIEITYLDTYPRQEFDAKKISKKTKTKKK